MDNVLTLTGLGLVLLGSTLGWLLHLDRTEPLRRLRRETNRNRRAAQRRQRASSLKLPQ